MANPVEIAKQPLRDFAFGMHHASEPMQAGLYGEIVKHVLDWPARLIPQPMLPVGLQPRGTHGGVIGCVPVQKNAPCQSQIIVMKLQIGGLISVGVDRGQKPLVVIVIASDEVKLTVGMLPNELIDPIDRSADGGVDRSQCRPAKVKNVAAEHKSARPPCGSVQCRRMLRCLRAARKQVQV